MLEWLIKKLLGRKQKITLREAFNEIVQIQDPNIKNLSEADLNPYYAAFLCGLRPYGKNGYGLYLRGKTVVEGLSQEFPHFGYSEEVETLMSLFYRIGERLGREGELIELENKKIDTGDLEDEIQKLKINVVETPNNAYITKPIGCGLW